MLASIRTGLYAVVWSTSRQFSRWFTTIAGLDLVCPPNWQFMQLGGQQLIARPLNRRVNQYVSSLQRLLPTTSGCLVFGNTTGQYPCDCWEVGNFLSFAIGNYQRGLLKGQVLKTATLLKRQNGTYYINIQLESQPELPQETDKVLGVDLGRTDIAVSTDGDKYSGKQITKIRDHYANLRAKLQQKALSIGTRSSRRRCRELQKRLSGKEKHFQSHINHVISYQLVQKAKTQNQVIALEDLTGIRERTNELPRTKTERRRSNSWSFYQLRFFLSYKCIKFGVKLVLVNPAYTSRTCHNCLHIHPEPSKSYRSGKSFRCGHCGWHGDADLNGAINISALGRLINSPGGSGALSCSVQDHVLRAAENPTQAREFGGKSIFSPDTRPQGGVG